MWHSNAVHVLYNLEMCTSIFDSLQTAEGEIQNENGRDEVQEKM